jgi:hypothetical protein
MNTYVYYVAEVRYGAVVRLLSGPFVTAQEALEHSEGLSFPMPGYAAVVGQYLTLEEIK